ncbi:carbon-nitrogen hydrolase family protein [Paracoccus sp. S-4012]|uniref:carbon-nitrogen hydrolase family protein n=1 Tax=Paracoccus sp. S-4012 TaxID=2665648 RepID=UPI0012AF9C49|nr:carbon-nitrogen hydrolase family protein [Paracoccus sp. S-4012]MRX49275.1 carbon-nitrogen hydrolase family protein [Paracoccus sp. S-4012]
MRAGLVQLTSGDDPEANLPETQALIDEAAGAGAGLILTPECTNIVSSDRAHQRAVLRTEAEDQTLAALRAQAAARGVWLLIGSLMLRADDPAEERLVNRSLLLAPDGRIAARYDKIHMFDADPRPGESYRESAAVRPGEAAVMVREPLPLGLTICYDLRFPALYRRLAQAGAEVLTVPAAFTVPTGEAHWEVLLRARAIETGCYVLAPAQCGTHPSRRPTDRPRRSYGHSLAVAPWGEVLADGGTAPGVTLVEIDPEAVAAARRRIASLKGDREFSGP